MKKGAHWKDDDDGMVTIPLTPDAYLKLIEILARSIAPGERPVEITVRARKHHKEDR